MPSAKSGSAASLVPPAAPDDTTAAIDSKPGDNTAARSDSNDSSGGGSSTKTDKDPPTKPHKKDPTKKSWIEIVLVDEDDKPVPGVKYKITLPDDETAAEGTLDGKGFARVEGFDPGTCRVTFPELDKDAWEPK